MKIRPLGDRVVIKKVQADEKTQSGIILPGTVADNSTVAEVVEAGPGGLVNGCEVKMEVKAGDRIIYENFNAVEYKLEGEKYFIIRQDDILAVLED